LIITQELSTVKNTNFTRVIRKTERK